MNIRIGVGLRKIVAKAGDSGGGQWYQIAPYNYVVDHPWVEGESITVLVDELAQQMVVEAFLARGNDIVVDYEHQTLHGTEAPAAGWIRELEGRGPDGLWGRIEWTERARQYLSPGSNGEPPEYRYDSPVFDYQADPPHRMVRLRQLAITNDPGSWSRRDITEQIAAKAALEYHNETREEGMKEKLKEVFGRISKLSAKSKITEVRTLIEKALEAVPASEGTFADEEGTIGALVGLEPPAVETVIAAPEVLAELGLEGGATLAQIHAKLGELKAPAGMVAKADFDRLTAELEKAKAEIATLSAKSDDEALNTLIEQNRGKVPPVKEPWFRGIAKRHGLAHAKEVLAQMKQELPVDQASNTSSGAEGEIEAAATRSGAVTMETRRGKLEVDPESATLAAKVQAIQKEKGCDYRTAHAELRKREGRV